MTNWTLDDINWNEFDASQVKPELIAIVKAAAMVEHNGYEYARYLREIFTGDEEFQNITYQWADEEVQHGKALRKWAELADPTFDFDKSFEIFINGIKLPTNLDTSIRGSRSGELISRCVVETGTSLYYTAIKDYTDEPVLKTICAKIAADELRHYKMFYDHLKRYLKKEKISFARRFMVALGRITETEDDELAYAFYAAHNDNYAKYDHKFFKNLYGSYAYPFYKREHVERMTVMVFKAIGLKPHTMANRAVNKLAWKVMQYKAAA